MGRKMTGSDYSHEWRRDLADTLDRIGDALGKLAAALADHERRIAAIERKLNHKKEDA